MHPTSAVDTSFVKSDDYVARLRDTLLNETLLWLIIVSLPMAALSLARGHGQGRDRPVAGDL